jgi:hypothetical protein
MTGAAVFWPPDAEVVNADTGERLRGVVSVTIRLSATDLPRAVIEVVDFDTDVEAVTSDETPHADLVPDPVPDLRE